MNDRMREKLKGKLMSRAKIPSEETLCYRHCKLISGHIDCDPNSVARLLGLDKFKATQKITPEMEMRISDYLGYTDFSELEYELMLEIVMEDLKKMFQNNKEKGR
jgi:hypothetical protein